MKYDKWGAQGKMLAVLEVFRREGIVMERGKLEKFVNLAFPRTFSCQRVPGKQQTLPPPRVLEEYRASMVELFREFKIPVSRVERMALEETAERFCLDPGFLNSYLTDRK